MSVGVIVPVYGPAPYLVEALEGVLDQEPAPEHVIVVDDGSPTPVVLEARHASRCSLIRHEQRRGPGAARDTAVARLDTELIACADADDVWRPGKLPAQLAALKRYPDAALCFGSAQIAGPDGRPTGERWRAVAAGLLPPSQLGPLLFEHNPIPTSSVVARRAAVIAAGGFDGLRLCEDWALWLRMLEQGESFVFEPGAAITYRRHAGGATADITALAECTLALHEAHSALVDEPTRRRVKAADLTALARGRVRERRYRAARGALTEAAAQYPPAPRERALWMLLGVPLLRAALGRRDPYNR